MPSDAQRKFLWQEVQRLYEESEMTLAEIGAWAERETGWGPSPSGITNRASRNGWKPRARRCPIFPAGMLGKHLRDHYANAIRAEAKARRGDRLSSTEFEKWSQASSMIDEGLVLAYTAEVGFFAVERPHDLPEDEWLSWYKDFERTHETRPLSKASRLLLRRTGGQI